MEHHSSKFMPAVVAGLGFTLLLVTAGRAETGSVPCEPSPPVKQALRELPLPSPERGSMLETLLDRFPGDLFVNRAYQDAAGFPGSKDFERSIARYRELAEQQPGLTDSKTGQILGWQVEWGGWLMAADAALKLEDACTARDAVQRMKVLMRKLKPSGEADAKDASAARQQYQHAVRQAAYWERLGSLTEMEGRGMDALVFYQNALVVRPQPRKGMPRRPKDELAEKARLLWKQHGGTDEGWQAWLSRKELGAPVEGSPDLLSLWTRLKKPLPDFELTDLGGNKWTPSDLKGKVTFANVWATWCEPCRVEMPHVEKLYEKFKDRKDVLVLTFNIDDNIGLIEPCLKKGGYSFPVLPAKSLVDAVFPSLGIPQNWIIDTNGVLQVMQRGFGPSGEKWTGQMLEAIEKVRTAK